MSALDHNGFVTHLPLNEGLLEWTRKQSRDTWHEMARNADFKDPAATIDLLLAVNWICGQPDCDRATALLILTRAAEAGLQGANCPRQLAPAAAMAFSRTLHHDLETGRFAQQTLHLTARERVEIAAQLGRKGPLPLPADIRRTLGKERHRPAYGFRRQRPVLPPLPV